MYSGNQNKQTINLMVKQSEKQANTQTDGRTASKPIPPTTKSAQRTDKYLPYSNLMQVSLVVQLPGPRNVNKTKLIFIFPVYFIHYRDIKHYTVQCSVGRHSVYCIITYHADLNISNKLFPSKFSFTDNFIV